MKKKLPEVNRFYLSRKLIGVVAIFIVAASGLVVLTNFAINMTAASGDYSALLSRWSQHHFQAGIHLEHYSRTGDSGALEAYEHATDRKYSIKKTIDELFKDEPDAGVIFQTFEEQSVSLSEVAGLLFAFQYLNGTELVEKIQRQWNELNQIEIKQAELVSNLKQYWQENAPTENVEHPSLAEYNELHKQWNNYNIQLTNSVSEASNVIKQFGLWFSVILGILLVLIGVVFTVRANKSIEGWEEALYEKEVLLAEIHHRVKNNLAFISGMLELESMQNKDSDLALKVSQNRIQSMAMIHEQLYQSGSFSKINLGEYMNELIEHITTYVTNGREIIFDTHFEDVQVNINQAIPAGLILNEIMTSTIEAGHDEEVSETISVTLHELKGKVELYINNDARKDLVTNGGAFETDTTGTEIVQALVQQLDAELTLENKKGIAYHLIFKKSDASGSGNSLF